MKTKAKTKTKVKTKVLNRHRLHRATARRVLHNRIAEPVALYVKGVEDPVIVTARLHDQNRMIGDLKGTSFDFALRHENTPELVFLVEEFGECNDTFHLSSFDSIEDVVRRGTIARFEDADDGTPLAVEIDNAEPTHGVTKNAFVTLTPDSEACLFDPPSVVTCPAST